MPLGEREATEAARRPSIVSPRKGRLTEKWKEKRVLSAETWQCEGQVLQIRPQIFLSIACYISELNTCSGLWIFFKEKFCVQCTRGFWCYSSLWDRIFENLEMYCKQQMPSPGSLRLVHGFLKMFRGSHSLSLCCALCAPFKSLLLSLVIVSGQMSQCCLKLFYDPERLLGEIVV